MTLFSNKKNQIKWNQSLLVRYPSSLTRKFYLKLNKNKFLFGDYR